MSTRSTFLNSSAQMSRLGLHDDRVFKPQELYGPNIDVDAVTDSDGSFTYVPCWAGKVCKGCGKLPRHLDQIIIAVDGGCKNNGFPGALSSIGVFFGDGAPDNISSISPSGIHTSQMAELTACAEALSTARWIHDDRIITMLHGKGDLNQVVIKTDSEHLFLGMTERVFKWEKNGWLTAGRKPVAHRLMFENLQYFVAGLKRVGVEVLFWLVPRERNRDADALASYALQ